MKKPWLAVALITLLSGFFVIAWVAHASSPSEPEYQGKKLTRWVKDLDDTRGPAYMNAVLAIRQMGTNAVPFLLQMFHSKDSRVEFEKHLEACTGLIILGPDAKAAIP